MSAGPSLYRRHRPRTFAEVVGQEHVVRTLSNAVTRDRVHHAYLFVGSRGTGKTSMAKILAACLNCERGPTIEPCGVCDSCVSIASATSLDVAEMDAASSNSVDDIRALRESVAYAPVSGRQKIFILDEAHMLSTAAWNAFLKTLEEPPPNTVFVLATTEAQKVPATVIDRCHRFDFQRPTAEQIATVLRRTAAAESIEIPDQALMLLARHAAGSFRDALGTLEQLQTYSGGEITLPDVLAVLGLSNAELLFTLIDAIIAADARAALLASASAMDSGRDAAAFTRELEAHARELLVVQTLGAVVPPELRLTAEHDERLVAQAGALGAETLVRLLELLSAALIAVRAGADARTQLELAVIRAARPDSDPSATAFSARLERLEGGAAALRAPAPQPSERNGIEPAAPAEPAKDEESSTVSAASAEEPLSLDRVLALWPAVLETVRSANAMLGAVVEDARPVELVGSRLVVAFTQDGAFQQRKAEDSANRTVLTRALAQVTGHELSLDYQLREREATPPPEPLSEEELVRLLKDEFDAEQLADTGEEEDDD
ncbi:MAG: DNA polymerase III subunit gamma/tau [Solirubrobacteraceae bacterium]